MTKSRRPPLGPSVEAFDRGEAKYFHGREDILRNFSKILGYAEKKNGGTSFLIQGPPGAGKTALTEECRKQAETYGWKTAHIRKKSTLGSQRIP